MILEGGSMSEQLLGNEPINCKTIVMDALPSLKALRRQPIARQVFLSLYKQIYEATKQYDKKSVFVAAADLFGNIVGPIIISDGASLTIGRHAQCAFRLPALDVSLRHVVAHVRSNENNDMVTRLWDLNTKQSFITEDGVYSSALVAEGALFITIGHYSLMFVPLDALGDKQWPQRGEDAWSELPQRKFLDRRDVASQGDIFNQQPNKPNSNMDITQITRVNAPVMLGEDVDSSQAWGKVTIEIPTGKMERFVSEDQINRGILIGRYSRCQIRLDNDDSLSRVHLMLVKIGQEIWAIDTASTNGTRHNAKEITSTVMALEDKLLLAATTLVKWVAIPPPVES